jgi:DhnA family fructose-bisphosphate aldolase class Ia
MASNIEQLPGPTLSIGSWPSPTAAGRAAQLPAHPQLRAPRRHRLCEHPAGRPGHRALGGRVLRPEPLYFDPENIVKLAIEGGCNAVASTSACWGRRAQVRPQDPLPRQVQPQRDADLPQHVQPVLLRLDRQCFEMGAVAVGATIYFGSDGAATRSSTSPNVRRGPRLRHGHGAVVLHPQQRLQGEGRGRQVDYHASADLTGQANHLGVTIQADIIKQKLPTNNGGYAASTPAAPPTASGTRGVHQARRERREGRTAGTPSTSAATRSSTTTWGAAADQLRRREQGASDLRRRSAPPSSTSAPAAWA